MKSYLFLAILILAGFGARAQCEVSSLVINTGYDPSTGFAITPGTDGGTPVPDPHWIITAETPSIAIAISGLGLTEVPLGGNADVIVREGSWVANPALNFGNWLSCLNSNTYNTDGTGPFGTPYAMTFGRPFRMCVADSITLDFYISNDNYMPSTDMDGTPLLFSQPAIDNPANFTSYTHYNQTIYLTAGTHTFHCVVNNYNDNTVESNPTGLNIYGTVSSSTGINSLVYEGDPACGAYVCGFVPDICNTLSMPDSLKSCRGDSAIIPATMTGTDSVLSLFWYPATGLSSDSVLDPMYHFGGTSGWYHLTMESINPTNLVVNGSFTYGNSGFSSGYIYSPPPSTILLEGYYSVYTNPFGVHTGFTSFGDHTTGTGNMMIINGAGTPIDVWCETIDVTPNTNYDFSAWFANCSSEDVGVSVPTLQFKINGVLQGVPTTVTEAVGVWVRFFTTWNSGTNTTANICIYDSQTSTTGNDFVIDDIAFQPICVDTDSIYLKSTVPDTVFQSRDTTICVAGGPITLVDSPGFATYLWNNGSTTSSIVVSFSGTYWAYATLGCFVLVDTFHVNFITSPAVFIGNDTAFCTGNTITLKSVQPFGNSYLWNTGATIDSINVSTTGTYWLQVTTPPGCVTTDSIHVLVSPLPVVNLGPDVFECGITPVPMSSSVIYSGPSYLWNDGTVNPTDTAFISGTYWLQVTVAGCASADTINVTIKFDTLTLYTRDTAICLGNTVHVEATANPAISCQWVPTAGISLSNVLDATITADTSAEYVLTGTMPGCPDIVDSFFLDVQPNPNVYIGGGRLVCQYDTLHLPAWVNPSWYTHYSYSWTLTPAGTLDTNTPSVAIFTAGVSSELVLNVSTPAGCSEKDSAQIVVRPGDFAAGDTSVTLCPGDSIQLQPTGGVSYVWHPGAYLSDSTVGLPWIHAITNMHYSVLATSAYGCKDTVNFNLNIEPAAVLTLGDSTTIYPGESYQVNALTNCEYFAWFPPTGLSSAYIANPLATPSISTQYVVLASTSWGCSIQDTLNIYVDPSTLLAVPNAFTPGNGVNTELLILKRGLANLNYFRIYDRWGVEVFEANNIDAGWDGTYKGQPQPQGVYVYEIEAVTSEGVVFRKQGNITLLR